MIAHHGTVLPMSRIPHRMRSPRQRDVAKVHHIRHENVAERFVTAMRKAGLWRHSTTTTRWILAMVGTAGLVALSIEGLAAESKTDLSARQIRRVLTAMCEAGWLVRTWRGTKDGGASRYALGPEYLRVAGRRLLHAYPEPPEFNLRGEVVQTQPAISAGTVLYKHTVGHPDEKPFVAVVERRPKGADRPVRTAGDGPRNRSARPPGSGTTVPPPRINYLPPSGPARGGTASPRPGPAVVPAAGKAPAALEATAQPSVWQQCRELFQRKPKGNPE